MDTLWPIAKWKICFASVVLLLPLVKGPLADSKVPNDVFGLAPALVLLYGLDDLTLIESTCFHYPKNQKLYLSLFQSFGGNTRELVAILERPHNQTTMTNQE